MREFLRLFRCLESRLAAQDALEYTALGQWRKAASYWALAYELEQEFRSRSVE